MTEPTTTPRSGSLYSPESESESAPSAPAGPKTSVWEDFIDILYAPAQVFERRAKDGSAWPAMLFVTIGIAIVMFAIAGPMQPVMDAEFARQSAIMVQKNPALTPDKIEGMRGMMEKSQQFGAIIMFPIMIFITGFVTWLVSKLFEAKLTLGKAVMIVGYAFVPRFLATVLMGVQALVLDMSKVKGMMGLTYSPARFFDPSVASPANLAVLSRFDVFVLWSTLIIGVGVSVVGKVSRKSGYATAAVIWVLATAVALLGGLRQM